MVGETVVWAFAVRVANAMKIARLNKTAVELPFSTDMLRANDARLTGLTFRPSLSGDSWFPDLYGVQEGIIQLPMQLTCSTILHPEALLKLCVSNKRGDIEPANISFSDIQAGFFNKKSGPTNWPADL